MHTNGQARCLKHRAICRPAPTTSHSLFSVTTAREGPLRERRSSSACVLLLLHHYHRKRSTHVETGRSTAPRSPFLLAIRFILYVCTSVVLLSPLQPFLLTFHRCLRTRLGSARVSEAELQISRLIKTRLVYFFLSAFRRSRTMSSDDKNAPQVQVTRADTGESARSLRSPRTPRFTEATAVNSPIEPSQASRKPFENMPTTQYLAPQPQPSDIGFGYIGERASTVTMGQAVEVPMTPKSPLKSALRSPGAPPRDIPQNVLSPTWKEEEHLEKREEATDKEQAKDLVSINILASTGDVPRLTLIAES